jgi:acetate---CoA ligase (ADP-forming)
VNSLVEIKNPLDITPGADDEAHVLAVSILSEDPNIDAIVVGLDPLSPAMRTLAECEAQRYNIDDQESIALQMPPLADQVNKPVVGVVDGGRLYDPLVDELMSKGMVVFRSSDRAIQTLALYIEGRLIGEQILSHGRNQHFGSFDQKIA